MRAGLWEVATDVGAMMASAMSQDRLAKLTPEQRAQVEAMMKQSMSRPGTRVCYTEEKLRRGFDYKMENAGSTCTSTLVSNDGSKMVREISCDSGRVKTRGTITFRFEDREHFSGLMQSHGEMNGKPQDMTVKMSGKWIGSDRGDVKPHDYSK